MTGPKRAVRYSLIALASLLMAAHCEEDPSCEDACDHLARCESEWLEDEGSEALNAVQIEEYVADCVADCEDGNEDTDSQIDCIRYATCEELRDGECR